ncbi:NAD(P)/FAD-dependent oxidoreductase [Periweissella cryptocerci]|uniref:NADH:ubiquinone reductase (non-electrogenic) n=1 Tax=Periweissella cryptocerci TaxID=2506420 RepID=A0A4P6YTA6_9LACO|nr:NAD(P)/FAD-dependent oxidoreductase [Periweissella cryptocerci]QBO35974.1 NAD(P)/FAD-dependent oxidoreductase [Periweissella cryptocerci]
MAKKNIVVVGAGFAGVFAAKHLAKGLKKNDDYQIILVDRHSYFTYMTELHEVATKRVEPKHIQYDLQHLFGRRKNVSLVTADVTKIDKENKTISTTAGEISFEKLVLTVGGESNDFGTPGVKEFGHEMWSMEQALDLRHHIEAIVAEGAGSLDPKVREAKLTFAVVGSGFTGVELMGELIEQRKVLAQANKLREDEIKLVLLEAAPTILNMLDRQGADKALAYMKKKGVDVRLNAKVTEVRESEVVFADGTTLPTESLVWTAGVKAKETSSKWGLETGKGGRFQADDHMRAVGEKDIYLAGDSTTYQEPARKDQPGAGFIPQTVEGAESAVNTLVPNIVAEVNGNEGTKIFKGVYQGYAVSIGTHYTVATLYEKYRMAGFFANIMKHIINLRFFIQIYSAYHIFHYMMNEFFRTPNERTMFYGWTSRLGNVLWSVPLRIFYGAMWLVDVWYKLPGHTDDWFSKDLRLQTFTWLQKATETSGASAGGADAAAATAAPVADPTFTLSYTFGKTPMPIFDHLPKWYEAVTKVMIPNEATALLMQKVMTVVELLLALAILAGLFTWLASAVTIGLVVVFSLSGMFYWTNMWMPFAALAIMNGSGRAFGLDYWAVPWLQKHLGKWWYRGYEASTYNQLAK